MKTKYCPNCGKEIDINASKCTHCGFIFNNSQNQAPQQPAPQRPRKSSKKFIYVLSCLLILLIALGGYAIYTNRRPSFNQSQSSHSSSSSSSNTDNNSSSQSSSSSYHDNINWDSSKASSFDDQFQSWANKMHQSYTSGDTTFDGVSYPQDFSKKRFVINGNDATVSMAGSNKKTDYKVVEIRYDSDQGYLYIFAFHDGSPIVLFTQSGNASDDSVSFKTTANGELRNLFSNFSAN
ncbi:MAG TPA: zinc ribbon domain-containing protein [Candidatus Limosilactobacillus merdigallinarum]|uniref:Zinc ribbon domain-containing protein n=1 Tax=Candidatus Limosilactobacillus merdigallinarum TaxID=2838652 RepID=A0A9D1VIK6_9LACO|nr:zinc ribbon domain-containing protein [Candidatus Limosilactobacillus merdigallinarum]